MVKPPLQAAPTLHRIRALSYSSLCWISMRCKGNALHAVMIEQV